MKIQKFLLQLLAVLVIFLFGLLTGAFISQYICNKQNSKEKTIISNEIILERISNKGILVTQSIINTESVTIAVEEGSDWSNFWWGHKITAEGTMQVNLGIDLAKLTKEDITVDDANKTIYINFPEPEVTSVSLQGDITVERESGILHKLFANDDNKDYNLALQELTSQAEKVITENETIKDDAINQAVLILNFIFQDTEYKIAFAKN